MYLPWRLLAEDVAASKGASKVALRLEVLCLEGHRVVSLRGLCLACETHFGPTQEAVEAANPTGPVLHTTMQVAGGADLRLGVTSARLDRVPDAPPLLLRASMLRPDTSQVWCRARLRVLRAGSSPTAVNASGGQPLGEVCFTVPCRAASGAKPLENSISGLAVRMDAAWSGLETTSMVHIADQMGQKVLSEAGKSNWAEVARLAKHINSAGWEPGAAEQCKALAVGKVDNGSRTALHLAILALAEEANAVAEEAKCKEPEAAAQPAEFLLPPPESLYDGVGGGEGGYNNGYPSQASTNVSMGQFPSFPREQGPSGGPHFSLAAAATLALVDARSDLQTLAADGDSPLALALRSGHQAAAASMLPRVTPGILKALGIDEGSGDVSPVPVRGPIDWETLQGSRAFGLVLFAAEVDRRHRQPHKNMQASYKASALREALCHAVSRRYVEMGRRVLEVMDPVDARASSADCLLLERMLRLASEGTDADSRWFAVAEAQLRRGVSAQAWRGGQRVVQVLADLVGQGDERAQELLVEVTVGRERGRSSDEPRVLFPERAAECAVCFEPLYQNAPAFFVDDRKQRSCMHYVCGDCAETCLATKECPMCRATVAESMELPSLEADPRGWFAAAACHESGALEPAELCHAVAACLPVSEERLLRAIEAEDGPWKCFWDHNSDGRVSEEEFFTPDTGLFAWIFAHLHELHRAEQRTNNEAPDMRTEPAAWFDFWDDQGTGTLTFGEVLRGVFVVHKFSALEDRSVLRKVRAEVATVWREVGLQGDTVTKAQFLKPNGLSARLAQLSDSAGVPRGAVAIAALPASPSMRSCSPLSKSPAVRSAPRSPQPAPPPRQLPSSPNRGTAAALTTVFGSGGGGQAAPCFAGGAAGTAPTGSSTSAFAWPPQQQSPKAKGFAAPAVPAAPGKALSPRGVGSGVGGGAVGTTAPAGAAATAKRAVPKGGGPTTAALPSATGATGAAPGRETPFAPVNGAPLVTAFPSTPPMPPPPPPLAGSGAGGGGPSTPRLFPTGGAGGGCCASAGTSSPPSAKRRPPKAPLQPKGVRRNVSPGPTPTGMTAQQEKGSGKGQGKGAISPEALETLKAMGFPELSAVEALSQANGNVDRAVAMLVG